MKLITEEVQKVKFITEGKGANKKLYIEGVRPPPHHHSSSNSSIPLRQAPAWREWEQAVHLLKLRQELSINNIVPLEVSINSIDQ